MLPKKQIREGDVDEVLQLRCNKLKLLQLPCNKLELLQLQRRCNKLELQQARAPATALQQAGAARLDATPPRCCTTIYLSSYY
jgi:hypothetical protein